MDQWYPPAKQINIPLTNFVIGHDDRLAVCLHIMNSTMSSCISWFKSPASGVSAHFGIDKDGTVAQFVSMNNSANAQGLHYDASKGQWYTERKGEGRVNVRPSWSRLTPGMNINRRIIAIEHAGKPGEPLTPAMTAAQTALLQWLREQLKLTYVVGSTLIGHSMLDNINRAYCPGSAFDLAAIAMAGNGVLTLDWSALWGDAAHYNPTFGIPTAWRDQYRLGKPLGKALTDELQAGDGVVQIFEKGWIRYSPVAGIKVGWW